MLEIVGVLFVIGLLWWAFSGISNSSSGDENVKVKNYFNIYTREARSSTLLYRFILSCCLFIFIVVSLIIGWYLTSLTNNFDFIAYAVGASLGFIIIYIAVKSIINISENTYVSTLLQADMLEATNKNSALIEALLINSDKIANPEEIDEFENNSEVTTSMEEFFSKYD